jgi:hypothetical protein
VLEKGVGGIWSVLSVVELFLAIGWMAKLRLQLVDLMWTELWKCVWVVQAIEKESWKLKYSGYIVELEL